MDLIIGIYIYINCNKWLYLFNQKVIGYIEIKNIEKLIVIIFLILYIEENEINVELF